MRHAVRILLTAACAAAATLVACAHADVESRLQTLEREADRQAVVRLIHQYAQGIDGGDEALLRRTFLPDAVAEYRGVNFPMDVRLEGIVAIWEWLNAQVGDREGAMPWHYMDTELVDLDGDRARMTVYQHNRLLSGVGVYTVDAVRTRDGWRIEQLHLDERILDPKLLDEVHTPETRKRIQR